jgi:hypothetical protein
MPNESDPDFWLYRWQFNKQGQWIDSITDEERKLPPIEHHKREWCSCPLCKPERWVVER